jgi:hypothetical protein
MRTHNHTRLWRSSLGVLGAMAFIHPPRLLRALCASAEPPPPVFQNVPQCSSHPSVQNEATCHSCRRTTPLFQATWLLWRLPRQTTPNHAKAPQPTPPLKMRK